MTEVSPTKWHLAHTTWFFETFILVPQVPAYRLHNERYPFLFNSYYVQAGERHCRARRGYLSRPTVEEVWAYREAVDRAMEAFLSQALDPEVHELVELGIAVRDRIVEQDLRFLLVVLNWATMTRSETGGVLLERNPLKGFPVPKEKNPRRVVLKEDEYEALLTSSDEVDWRFRVALVLAHETGHRIGAIRKQRWSDVHLCESVIHWRAENDKIGFEHSTPMIDATREVLELARQRNPGIGDAPLLPAPKDPSKPISRRLARNWWKRAEKLAGLAPLKGRGWHSARHKFASDYWHNPPKVVADLGGWKDTRTLEMCYQHPDQDQLREALKGRRRAFNQD